MKHLYPTLETLHVDRRKMNSAISRSCPYLDTFDESNPVGIFV
jgi:hypothetical protein